MAEVILKNVNKIFPGEVHAVKDVDLKIADKEFLVLVGPSGCGKSTTLRMVAGLEEITSGQILIGDKLVNDVPPSERDIAMVFQNYALYPHMTVYDNMAFGLKLRKYSKDEIERRVKEASEILGIEALLERKPKALSGGQRQRVAVGRAIVRKPKVFLFDEPLSNLDAKLRVQMRTEIGKLHTRLQTTMIYVTHDQTEAMTMGDNIVVMKDGVIQQVSDPIHLYDNPNSKFVAGFIGSPPMNFLDVKVVKAESGVYLQAEKLNVKVLDTMVSKVENYIGKEVILGIRPEDIKDRISVPVVPPESTVTATTEVVEPLGSVTYLHLSLADQSFIAAVDPHDNHSVNQDIELVFSMDKIQIFDKDTEASIVQ